MTDARTFAELAARSLEPAAVADTPPAPKAEPRPGTVVLRLDKPFSTNAMYRSFSRGSSISTIKSAAYRAWHEHALALIATQKWTPIEGAFSLQIKVPKGTRQDLDNTVKAQADVLRAAGVIVDDSPKYMRRLEVLIGLDNHTTLTIKPLELETADENTD